MVYGPLPTTAPTALKRHLIRAQQNVPYFMQDGVPEPVQDEAMEDVQEAPPAHLSTPVPAAATLPPQHFAPTQSGGNVGFALFQDVQWQSDLSGCGCAAAVIRHNRSVLMAVL